MFVLTLLMLTSSLSLPAPGAGADPLAESGADGGGGREGTPGDVGTAVTLGERLDARLAAERPHLDPEAPPSADAWPDDTPVVDRALYEAGLAPVEASEGVRYEDEGQSASTSTMSDASYEGHGPILILGDDDFEGAGSGVRRGAGTAEDPYVIEGWRIRGDREVDAIHIEDTRAHVVIRGNLIESASGAPASGFVGVWIIDAANVRVEDNVIRHTFHALHFRQDDGVAWSGFTFSGNVVEDTYYHESCSLSNGYNPCAAVSLQARGAAIDGNTFTSPRFIAAIFSNGLSDSSLSFNTFRGSGGIDVNGVGGNVITNNTVLDAWRRPEPGRGAGISVGGGGNVVTGNVFAWSGDISLDPYISPDHSLVKEGEGGLVAENVFNHSGRIEVHGVNNATLRDNVLDGGTIAVSFGSGLYGGGVFVADADGVLVTGNELRVAAGPGIALFRATDTLVTLNALVADRQAPGNPILVSNTNALSESGGRVRGGNAFLENTATGPFDHLIYTSGGIGTMFRANTCEGCEWSYRIGASEVMMRDNAVAGALYGIVFNSPADANTGTKFPLDPDIDISNSVNGRPVLVLSAAGDVVLDGTADAYDSVSVLGAATVTIRQWDVAGRGYALHLEDVGRAFVEDSRFGPNVVGIRLIDSVGELRNVTFAPHGYAGVHATRGHLTVEGSTFTDGAVASRFPAQAAGGWGVFAQDTTSLHVRSSTFQNHQAGILLDDATGSLVEDTSFSGGSFGVYGVGSPLDIRDSRFETLVFGTVLELGGGGTYEDNVLRDVDYGLVLSRYSTVRDNVILGSVVAVALGGGGWIEANLVVGPTLAPGGAAGVLSDGSFVTLIENAISIPGGFAISDTRGCSPTESRRFFAERNHLRWNLVAFELGCFGDGNADAEHQVADNWIQGNAWGLRFMQELTYYKFFTGYRLDVSANWWGDATGPAEASGNPDGKGDAIHMALPDTVTYAPWLLDAPGIVNHHAVRLEATPLIAPTGTPVALRAVAEAGAFGTARFHVTHPFGPAVSVDSAEATLSFPGPGDHDVVVGTEAYDGSIGLARVTVTATNRAPQLAPSVPATASIGEVVALDAGLVEPDGHVTAIEWRFDDGRVLRRDDGDVLRPNPVEEPLLSRGPDRILLDLLREVAGDNVVRVVVRAMRGELVQAEDVASSRYGDVVATWPFADALAVDVRADRVPDLLREPWVRSATLDTNLTLAGIDTADTIRSRASRELGVTGRGVGIAVLDTGLTNDHPDLAGRVLEGIDFSPYCPYYPEPCGDRDDDIGHGDAVASLMAGGGNTSHGARAGVAPGARLVDVRVSGSGEFPASVVSLMNAYQWVVDNADRLGIQVVYVGVVRNCVFCDDYDILSEATDALVGEGFVVVVPAGNEGLGTVPGTVTFPAASQLAITIGAVDDHGTDDISDDAVTWFSGRGGGGLGAKPDLVAPGVGLAAASSGAFGEGYHAFTGTSASAALVAGAAALLLEKAPGLTPDEVKSALTSTAREPPADTTPGPDNAYGWGILDARAALAAVDGFEPARPTHVFDVPGDHRITVTAVDDQGATTSAAVRVQVEGIVANFTWSPLVPRATRAVQFEDTTFAVPATSLTYAWEFGDGATSTMQHPSHTYATEGVYEVNLTVSAPDGRTSKGSHVVVVLPLVPADLDVLAPVESATGHASDLVVLGETAILRAVATDDDGAVVDVTFRPQGDAGPALAGVLTDGTYTAAWTPSATGAWTMEVVATDSDGHTTTGTRPIAVVENTAPVAAAAPTLRVDGLLTVTVADAGSFDPDGRPISHTWTLPDGTTTEGPTSTWTPTAIGTYVAVLTVTDSVGATSTATQVIIVDDLLRVVATWWATDPDSVGVEERPTLHVQVLDETGAGVAGSDVIVTVSHGSPVTPPKHVGAVTDDRGIAILRLPYDVGSNVGVNTPGEHRVDVIVRSASKSGAPDDSLEVASFGTTYTVEVA